MSKTVKNVKNSLKFKAVPKQNLLSIKIGVKKYSVPVEARMLSKDGYLYLSFSASSELYKVDGGTLNPLTEDSEAAAAQAALTPSRRRRKGKTPTDVELPDSVLAALKAIPSGHKLVPTADGGYRLVRTRVRRKKGE